MTGKGLRVVFRADATPAMGGGHVMRCLTLADELHRNGWSCTFATNDEALDVVPALGRSSHHVTGLANNDGFKNKAQLDVGAGVFDLMVIDHYDIGIEYEKSCQAFARCVMVIDDLAERDHDCDFLLDQNLGRSVNEYKELVPEACQILAGSHYALLRPQFIQWRERSLARRTSGRIEQVLVAMGMCDNENYTVPILNGIERSGIPLSVDVILGSGAPHLVAVQRKIHEMRLPVKLHVDVDDVASILMETDVAIGAGGGACWERCCLGVPSLLAVVARNQKMIVREMVKWGAAMRVEADDEKFADHIVDALTTLASHPERINEMSQCAARVCDGRGVNRLKLALTPKGLENDCDIVLRRADMSDMMQVLQWRNDPETRKASRTMAKISLEVHRQWFTYALSNRDHLIYIAEFDGLPVGIVRAHKEKSKEEQWEMSWTVAPEARSRGFGGKMVKMLIHKQGKPVCAYVRKNNLPSVRISESAGMSLCSEDGEWSCYSLV